MATSVKSTDAAVEQLAELAIKVLDDGKAVDLVSIDLRRRKSTMFDMMVICTASSTRHAAALADRLRLALKGAGHRILGVEGPGEMGWTLIDAGEVVAHIFLKEARSHYDLESLWELPGPG